MVAVGGISFIVGWIYTRVRVQGAYTENALERTQGELNKIAKELVALRTDQASLSVLQERSETERKALDASAKSDDETVAGLGKGGYIILDLPEDQRSLFYDLLKGFEDYAELKGYKIFFSMDSSFFNRIAFKFTLSDIGVTVSTEQVKKDIKEYIDKIQSGEPLDNLPVVLSPEEHDMILTTLKNRVNFLQMNYSLQKNATEFYERLLSRISSSPIGFLPPSNVYVQTGGTMDSRKYTAIDSSKLIQGDQSRLIDDSITANIRIGSSFNERKEQIQKLEKLVEVLRADKAKCEEKDKAIINLEKVKDEIADHDQPDKSRIAKWHEKVKEYLGLLKLGKHAADIAKDFFESFNLGDWFA